jgi:hypothetical protein
VAVRGGQLLTDEQAPKPEAEPPQGEEEPAADANSDGDVARFADFKLFRSSLSPWETIFREAADFATHIGPSRVISISHSQDGGEAIVTVWYWREAYEVQSSGP